MRPRAHRPALPYKVSDLVIGGKPVYEKWTFQNGLLTLHQLDELKRKYGPTQEPAAWLRYNTRWTARGRKYWPVRAIAPLYALEDSVPKRPCSPKQLAVLEAARKQRCICDYCGQTVARLLRPEQMCPQCAKRFYGYKAQRSHKASKAYDARPISRSL